MLSFLPTLPLGKFSIKVEYRKAHLPGGLGEFNPTLEDVLRLTHLPLFGDANAMGIKLDEDDQLKMKNL